MLRLLHKRMFEGGKRGSVLVFLTCILMSVIVMVTALCETASALVARTVSEAAAELAARSVLTNYSRELWQRYGLFGCVLNRDEMEDQFRFYVDKTFEDSGEHRKLVRCSLESVSIDLAEYSFLNPDVLENQILDHMKYRIVDSIFDTALLQDAEDVSNTQQLLMKAEPVYELYEEIVQIKEKVRPDWESWDRRSSQSDLDEDDYQRLQTLERKINRRLSDMRELRNRAFDRIADFHRAINSIKAGQSRETSSLEEMERDMERLEQELKALGDLSIHSISYDREEGNSSGERKRLKERLAGIKALFSGGGGSGSSGESLPTLRSQSIILELPTVLHGKQSFKLPSLDELKDIHGLLVKGQNSLYTSYYIKENFKNRVTEEGSNRNSFFQNEMEYILFGDYSDKKNQDSAEYLLFAFRSAINMAHVYSCGEKRAQSAAIAAGLTPGPAAVVTQRILLALWAAAEAGNDVRRLLKGERVPLIKTEADWHLDLDGILEGTLDGEKGTQKEQSEKGLRYGEYLTLFLLVKNREDKLIRMMDLIQLNMKGTTDGTFRVKDCFGGFEVNCEVAKESGIFGGGAFWIRRRTVKQTHVY